MCWQGHWERVLPCRVRCVCIDYGAYLADVYLCFLLFSATTCWTPRSTRCCLCARIPTYWTQCMASFRVWSTMKSLLHNTNPPIYRVCTFIYRPALPICLLSVLIYLISHHSSLSAPFLSVSLSCLLLSVSLPPSHLLLFSSFISLSLCLSVSLSLSWSPPLLFSSFISLSVCQSLSPPLHLISHPSSFSAPSFSLALSPNCYVVFSSLAV